MHLLQVFLFQKWLAQYLCPSPTQSIHISQTVEKNSVLGSSSYLFSLASHSEFSLFSIKYQPFPTPFVSRNITCHSKAKQNGSRLSLRMKFLSTSFSWATQECNQNLDLIWIEFNVVPFMVQYSVQLKAYRLHNILHSAFSTACVLIKY